MQPNTRSKTKYTRWVTIDLENCNIYYLVIAPSLLTGGGSERKGAVTTECNMKVGQIESAGHRASRSGEVAGKGLLQMLAGENRESVLVQGFKPTFLKSFGIQAQLPPCCIRHRRPHFHCNNPNPKSVKSNIIKWDWQKAHTNMIWINKALKKRSALSLKTIKNPMIMWHELIESKHK